MAKDNWRKIHDEAKEQETIYVKEKLWTNRIVRIILIILTLLIIAGIIAGYLFITNALDPVNSDNTQPVEVTIPVGSSTDDVAQLLEDQGLVSNADVFSTYMKFNNDQELQAGTYEFNQAMDAGEIVSTLQEGGEPIFVDADTTITVIEGMMLEELAQTVGETTAITAEEFMATANDEAFIQDLQTQFPSLLDGLLEVEGLQYPLEGYLYPATYDYFAGMTAEELITEMISAANLIYQDLEDDLANTYLNYHQVLTLASLIEREAVTEEDRGLVSGVFYNRLDIGMPLQSDTTVLYALGEHIEYVTYSDLEVDSPYNTYMYVGLPPGPINNPSREAIVAAIYPTWNDYYYFVADLDTGEIYYSSTIEEHNALVEQYVSPPESESEATTVEDETVIDENATEPVEETTEPATE